jgi:hypothetical protein
MRVLDLFSGIGGFSLGLERAGMCTVGFCEIDPFCRDVLTKHWPAVPIHDDVTTREFQEGEADVICGGFPCQDISVAGAGAGLAGERSGLWRELLRAIRVVRPHYAIVENVAALLGRGMGTVLGDLAEIGHDAEWHCIPALVRLTDATASGLSQWITPSVEDCKPAGAIERYANGESIPDTYKRLRTQAATWPTPQAFDAGNPRPPRLKRDRQSRDPTIAASYWGNLKDRVFWPTPRAEDSEQTGGHRGKPDTLTTAARLWPTPSARNWKGAPSSPNTLPPNSRPLNEVVRFATPTASSKFRSAEFAEGRAPNPQEVAKAVGGSLNPTWVEWLMGFPLGWTDLGRSATPSSRKSRK